MLVPPDNRLSQSGTLLTCEALRAAGVPVLMLDADMVDAKNWDHDADGRSGGAVPAHSECRR